MRWCEKIVPAVLLAVVFGAVAQADPVSGTLYFTTFAGAPQVHSVGFNWNGASLGLSSVTNIGSTIGADGLLFDPNNSGKLLVGGQSSFALNDITIAGGANSFVAVGAAGQSYHLALTPGGTTLWNMPNGGSPFISIVNLPFGTNGTSFPVSGSDTDVRGVAFIGSQGFYGSAGDGSTSGDLGLISFNGVSFTTTALLTGVPAHGLTFDPFTGDLIVSSGDEIQQYSWNGTTLTLVSSVTIPGEQFDQTAADGKGHLFAASNFGDLTFIDYDASGKIGVGSVQTQFLASNLDDVAPLSGLGSQTVPEPSSIFLLGSALLGVVGYTRRKSRPA